MSSIAGSKNLWRKFLPLAGLLVLIVIIHKIGFVNILDTIKDVCWSRLIILPFLIISVFMVQTGKWNIILRLQRIEIEYKKLFQIIMIGMFYASFTPGQLGGFVKIKYLRDCSGRTLSECSSSILIDKVIDLITLCFFAALGSVILARHLYLIIIPFLIIPLLFTIVFIALDKDRMAKIFRFILPTSLIPKKRKLKLGNAFNLFYRTIPKKKKLLLPFLLSMLTWLLIYTQLFVVARAFFININYCIFIFIMPLVSLVALIPITVSGVGTREAALLMILSTYGVTPEKTVGMSLLNLVLCIYFPALIGGILSIQSGIRHENNFSE